MPIESLMDETIWGIPGATIEAPLPGADTFVTTPLLDLLRRPDPDAIALVGAAGSLRYGDLLRLMQNAASAIAARVPPGAPVACLLPRTPEAIAALLGCLISGRLTMVLDPANPSERLATLIQDARPALLLADALPFTVPFPILALHEALSGPGQDWQPDSAWDPDAPFAVYFTSGSSGLPKGIVLSARSALYRALDGSEVWGLSADDRVFAPSVPMVGAALSVLLGALARGARVVFGHLAAEGAGSILRRAEQQEVTCAVISVAPMRVFFQLQRARSAFRFLRHLRIGSASLARADLATWRAMLPPDCRIWHSYASTEALFVSKWIVPAGDAGPEATVAAGIAQSGHDYALLDDQDRPVPPGAPGELVLRGPNIALGEWQGGRLVPGRMPAVPDRPGWRFFRTGDVLRLQPGGMLRVLGRADRQLKVNGVRVEPAEIEAILRAEPGVADAAVVARSAPDDAALHGFIVTTRDDRTDLIAALRRRLADALPAALRPAHLTILDHLPMLPSGKIDLTGLSQRTPEPTAG